MFEKNESTKPKTAAPVSCDTAHSLQEITIKLIFYPQYASPENNRTELHSYYNTQIRNGKACFAERTADVKSRIVELIHYEHAL